MAHTMHGWVLLSMIVVGVASLSSVLGVSLRGGVATQQQILANDFGTFARAAAKFNIKIQNGIEWNGGQSMTHGRCVTQTRKP